MPDGSPASSPPPFEGEVWVIANPVAGGRRGRRALERAIQLLRSGLSVAQVRWTEKRGDAEQWAREAVERNVALVVGGGGDGTLNEIANSLVGSDVTLGILPVGTANVVACELGVPLHTLRAARELLTSRTERIHLGRADYQPLENAVLPSPAEPPCADRQAPGDASLPGGRYFIFAAGIGFDAYVCHRLNLRFKYWASKAAYVIDGLRRFPAYPSPRLHVALDGGDPVTCSELVICNARAYAGRFWIAPEASLRKPRLDVGMFLRAGRWNLLRYAWGLVRGRLDAYPDVRVEPALAVEVEADNEAYLHLDGDALGTPPVRFTLVPDALSVAVPAR